VNEKEALGLYRSGSFVVERERNAALHKID